MRTFLLIRLNPQYYEETNSKFFLFPESFSMEERSNSITHINDENKDQSSDQIVRCDICARSFRTNRGLPQHFNFCRRRNRHEGDNINGNIQANNIDNLNNNEVVEINNATNSCQNNQEYSY